MWAAWQIAAPTAPWCTVAQAKQYLQFPYDTQDEVIAGQIAAAEDLVEAYLERGLRTQTWHLEGRVGYGCSSYGVESTESHADYFIRNLICWRPGDCSGAAGVDLRRAAPLQAIVKVEVNGLPFTDYRIEKTEPARLIFTDWPPADGDLVVEYTLGYSDDTSKVPGGLVEALRKLMATYFLHREEDPVVSFRVESRIDMLPVNVQQLLDPYRVTSLA